VRKIINIKIIVLKSLFYKLIDPKLVSIYKNVTNVVYDIVLRIITVLVSVTPLIFRRLSIHTLISFIVGA